MSCPPFYKFENTALGYRKYKWWHGDYPLSIPVDIKSASLHLTPHWIAKILIDCVTLYVNLRTLDYLQFAVVVKGQSHMKLEELIVEP